MHLPSGIRRPGDRAVAGAVSDGPGSTGERLNARRLAVGLAVNAISHYAIDRRDHGVMPHLCRALRRYGKPDFAAAGEGLATGAAHLDQAWHIAWCAISAAIIAGRD